ncbi:uncharacterized protein [Periplaneta americana]
MMSPPVKKRFPTLDHLVEAGFLQPNEKKIFEDLDLKTSHPKYWMPLVWAGGIITRARKEGRIKDDFGLKTLIDELNIFRSGCGGMLNYDWISIPLVYTQVVTLAVYTYFMATLMGNQFLDPLKGYAKHEVDLVVPVFTFLQFFFYMGWLKVAESLVNPFGEDDDDFELNWLVDRNLQVSYVIVDEMHQEHPEMVKDQYWDEVIPAELPYTVASKLYQTGPPPGSTDNVEVSLEQAEFIPLETVAEEAQEDVDDLGDIELDVEGSDGRGTRRETHPMKIITRQKTDSSGSINTSSYSGGPRGGRKSSVLNMLTRLFRREESSRDLAGSNMGSSISLPSRRGGQRSSSRMSSMSQAQSRTSIPRINTFQDEVFHMSDVSLTGSTLTTESPIQIAIHKAQESKQQNVATEDETEASQLISWSRGRDTPRKLSREKPVEGGDMKVAEVEVQVDNASEASESSVRTSFFQESWGAMANASEMDMFLSPHQKVSDVQKQAKQSKKYEWKDIAVSPLISLIDPYAVTESASATTQIVIPSSAPIRHMFTPLTCQVAPRQSSAKDDVIPHKSSLSRNLQQQHSVEKDLNKTSVPAAERQNALISSDIRQNSDPETVITILSPDAHFALYPSVSFPSVLVPTTSIVTTPSAGTSSTTVTTPAISAPVSCIVFAEKPPDIPRSDSEESPSSGMKRALVSQMSVPETSTSEGVEGEERLPKQSQSPPLSGPQPYIPSAAIPVPSVSPAHATSSSDDIELIEAAVVPLARRTHHDFHELEPISEHGETTTDSPMGNTSSKEEENETDEERTGIGQESTV